MPAVAVSSCSSVYVIDLAVSQHLCKLFFFTMAYLVVLEEAANILSSAVGLAVLMTSR